MGRFPSRSHLMDYEEVLEFGGEKRVPHVEEISSISLVRWKTKLGSEDKSFNSMGGKPRLKEKIYIQLERVRKLYFWSKTCFYQN